jgi:GNAT superfamily N-acetyltransferase
MLHLSASGGQDTEELEFVKFAGQDLGSFDCTVNGKDEQGLQEFIIKEAREYQERNLGVTYLVELNGAVVAFLTVAMTSILVERMREEEKVAGVPFGNYPALLVGRLAVDRQFRHKKIGSKICSWCLGLARDLSKRVGCRYVALHALDAVVPFYTRNFFILSEAEKGKPTKLLYRKVI